MQSDNESVTAMDQDIIATLPSVPASFQSHSPSQQQQQHDASGQPIKIRKKPGRKPNPASPALRKAQNRAAQRAFRERKERHMRELEVAIKQIREQRDKLHVENEQLKADQEILRSENWYLKGIVLSLQLVCFQHNLVIPQHGPYINEQALSVLAKSIPETISAYINVNASNKLPIPSKLFGYRHTVKQRDRYLSSGSIVITKEGVHSLPDHSASHQNHQHQKQTPSAAFSRPAPMAAPQTNTSSHISLSSFPPKMPSMDTVHPLEHPNHQLEDETANMPPLSPGSVASDKLNNNMQFNTNNMIPPLQPHINNNVIPKNATQPVMLTEEPMTSNLAAIQTLRLRLRLQSACVRMDSIPFAIQPTLLQLTIPHDPRIDLIPTPHMRDRMILFRDQFDLDDCFRLLLGESVFHGGDPGVAGNWQLPPEFFEKYWFLTIDYDLRRTTNHWRRLQGLSELDFNKQQNRQDKEENNSVTSNGDKQKQLPSLERMNQHNNSLSHTDLSALLGVDFWKLSQASINQSSNEADSTARNNNGDCSSSNGPTNNETSYASSLSSDGSYHSPVQTPGSPPATTSASTHGATTPQIAPSSSSENKFEPVRLTNGYNFPYPSSQHQKNSAYPFYHRGLRPHPYQPVIPKHYSGTIRNKSAETMPTSSWTSLLNKDNTSTTDSSLLSTTTTNSNNDQSMDITMSDLIDAEPAAF